MHLFAIQPTASRNIYTLNLLEYLVGRAESTGSCRLFSSGLFGSNWTLSARADIYGPGISIAINCPALFTHLLRVLVTPRTGARFYQTQPIDYTSPGLGPKIWGGLRRTASDCFGLLWRELDCIGLHQTTLDCIRTAFGPNWGRLDQFGLLWTAYGLLRTAFGLRWQWTALL